LNLLNLTRDVPSDAGHPATGRRVNSRSDPVRQLPIVATGAEPTRHFKI